MGCLEAAIAAIVWKEESHGEEAIEAANQEVTSSGETVDFPKSKQLSS